MTETENTSAYSITDYWKSSRGMRLCLEWVLDEGPRHACAMRFVCRCRCVCEHAAAKEILSNAYDGQVGRDIYQASRLRRSLSTPGNSCMNLTLAAKAAQLKARVRAIRVFKEVATSATWWRLNSWGDWMTLKQCPTRTRGALFTLSVTYEQTC